MSRPPALTVFLTLPAAMAVVFTASCGNTTQDPVPAPGAGAGGSAGVEGSAGSGGSGVQACAFTDPGLEAAVREALEMPTGVIDSSAVAALDVLVARKATSNPSRGSNASRRSRDSSSTAIKSSISHR